MMLKFKISRSDYPYITHSKVYDFEYEDDLKCAIKLSKEIVRRAKKEDKKVAKILKKIQEEKKPFWFKNLTHNQVAAANMIFTALQQVNINDQLNCIADIVINGFRVKKKPTKDSLLISINSARKSDLAFLWYLYKSVYKTADEICNQRKFTYDERIILSSICHLDMMTTLRQLDKILPQPMNESGKNIKDKVKILTPHPSLKIYDLYKDKFYEIENEENRWFEKDYLIPSKAHCYFQKIIIGTAKESANTKSLNEEAMCTTHASGSSKLNKFLECLRNENLDDVEINHNANHLTNLEQKFVCEIQSEFKKAQSDLKKAENYRHGQVINSALVNQLVDDAFNQRYLHLCKNCDNPPSSNHKLHFRDQPSSYDPKAVKYFHGPSISNTDESFKFDYDKIFSLHFLHDHGRDVVKKSINAALELNKYLTVDNAITACLRDMWRTKLREWNEKRQAEIEQRQQRVVADCSRIGTDKQRLFKLLRKGIALMRKNPKFVLAALPHSYRLPILKEWILQRYHVNYVYEDCIWGNTKK